MDYVALGACTSPSLCNTIVCCGRNTDDVATRRACGTASLSSPGTPATLQASHSSPTSATRNSGDVAVAVLRSMAPCASQSSTTDDNDLQRRRCSLLQQAIVVAAGSCNMSKKSSAPDAFATCMASSPLQRNHHPCMETHARDKPGGWWQVRTQGPSSCLGSKGKQTWGVGSIVEAENVLTRKSCETTR